jgi:hypothetical protein
MWQNIFKAVYLLHAALLVIAAIGLFRFWRSTRFWLPKYVHVLAGIGFVVMLWVLSMAPADAPVNRWGPILRFLFALALPAIVYFFFIFYGGQRVAFNRSMARQVPCPLCSNPVPAYAATPSESTSGIRFLESECPHCGQKLVS